MEKTMHEYAFDVKLFAVVRVKAGSETEARELLERVIDACDVAEIEAHPIKLTEFSLAADDSVYPQGAELFEIDGEEIPYE